MGKIVETDNSLVDEWMKLMIELEYENVCWQQRISIYSNSRFITIDNTTTFLTSTHVVNVPPGSAQSMVVFQVHYFEKTTSKVSGPISNDDWIQHTVDPSCRRRAMQIG